MTAIKRASSSNEGVRDTEKSHSGDYYVSDDRTDYAANPVGGPVRGIEVSEDTRLHRGLKARHITMIAIGGAVGTGLIIGTGKALAQAGPGSILISYTIVGFLVFIVMAGLGEMAAWLPMSSGFTGYASRFCDPSLGFALGWS
jgi:amino acid transporter